MNTFTLLAVGMGILAPLSTTPCVAQAASEPYTFTTLAGGGGYTANAFGSAARFRAPAAVAVDSAGNVYVVENGNHTISKVSPAGDVVKLAGQAGSFGSQNGLPGSARFDSPLGAAVDGEGNIYVADTANHTIRRVTTAGTVATLAGQAGSFGSANGTGGGARFGFPNGVAVDSGNNVYIADQINHTVRKVTATGVVTTLAGLPGFGGSADGIGNEARFNSPSGVAVDSSGNVYVADTWNSTLRMVTPAGVVTTLAGLPGIVGGDDGTNSEARFALPNGVAVDHAGNLYVADTLFMTIRKVTPVGKNWVVTTLAGLADVHGAQNGTGSAARFYLPTGVAVDGMGNVYVADTLNHLIRKVTPAGVVTTFAGGAGVAGNGDGTGTAAQFYAPTGVAVDSADNVYVADTYNNTIRKVTPGRVVTTLGGMPGELGTADGTGSTARFSNPAGLAVDSTGNVYVADFYFNMVRKGALAPRLISRAITDGKFDVELIGPVGHSIVLEDSRDLTDWRSFSTNFLGATSLILSHPITGAWPTRFFRARVLWPQ